jgi:hypothetical protein
VAAARGTGLGDAGADGALNRARGGHPGERARAGTRHGRRVGVQPELDPDSVARRGRGAWRQMTGGPHPSATRGGARGDGGERAALGQKIKLGRCACG